MLTAQALREVFSVRVLTVHFNHFCHTVQVEEIYTSGGDLHLELPTGEREASRELWVGVVLRN